MRRTGFVLGDVHFPFHQPVILSLAIYFFCKGKYDWIVQVGDLYDWYSAAKFPRSWNVFTPKQEKEWSRYYAEIMWGLINSRNARAEKYQLLGNHCVRPHKRLMEKAPEFEDDLIPTFNEHYTFEGVKTVYDSREELVVDDTVFMHGYYTGGGTKHAHLNIRNFVCGHTHTGGTWFMRNNGHEGGHIFEANAGYVADPYAKGLGYSAQKKATKWTWGFLHVDKWGPRFISLHPSMAEQFKDDPLFKEICEAFAVKI